MGVAALRARAELRGGWRGWLAATLIIGIGGAVALTAAGAARRTDTAFDRALHEGRAADVFVTVDATSVGSEAARRVADQIERDPSVVVQGVIAGVDLEVVHDGRIDARITQSSASGLVSETAVVGTDVSRLHLVAGRAARPDAADEVVVNPQFVALTGWRVGDRLDDVRLFGRDDLDAFGNADPAKGTPVPLHVVGIGYRPEDLLTPAREREHRIFLTPAFAAAHPGNAYYYADALRLRNGRADVPALRAAAASAVSGDGPFAGVVATAEGATQVRHGNRAFVGAMWLVAALAGLVAWAMATQAVARQLQAGATHDGVLRALGLTRRGRLEVQLLPVAIVTGAGAAGAAIMAVALSPLGPLGDARAAEPHPGVAINVTLLLVGAAALAVTIFATAMWPAWRLVSRSGTAEAAQMLGAGPSRLADAVARTRLPLPATMGARFALDRNPRRRGVPTVGFRATLVMTMALVVGVVTFGSNLLRLTSTPGLYGWRWDAAAGGAFATVPDDAVEVLRQLPHVSDAAGLALGQIDIGGRTIPAIGVDSLSGAVLPKIDRGRAPEVADEIALGATTMRAIHAHIGSSVRATIAGAERTLRVVGTVTLPELGQVRYQTGLGTGALTVASNLSQPVGSGGKYNYVALRFDSRNPAADIRGLRAAIAEGCPQPDCVLTDSRPSDLNGYAAAHHLLVVLAGLLVVLLLATLVHGSVITARRRRSDLAVLQALGLLRRQVAGALRWQGATLAVLALAIGTPLGVAIARWGWLALTHQLGVETAIVVPGPTLAAIAAGVVVAAVVLAGALARIPRASTAGA